MTHRANTYKGSNTRTLVAIVTPRSEPVHMQRMIRHSLKIRNQQNIPHELQHCKNSFLMLGELHQSPNIPGILLHICLQRITPDQNQATKDLSQKEKNLYI